MATQLIVVLSILISVSSVPQIVNVNENSIFVPFANRVTLTVTNITQFSAQLDWDLSRETRDRLKAMRINCTEKKSLVEPYDISNPPRINLYNPSIMGVRMVIKNLRPATQYSCTLVGALSLDVGREKLAILSEPIVFSTLLEKKGYQGSSKVNIVTYIVGVVVPLVLIILAVCLILFGYHLYNKKKKRNIKRGAEFRVDLGNPPSGSGPGKKKSKGKTAEREKQHKHTFKTSEKKPPKKDHKSKESKSSSKDTKDKKKHLKKKEKSYFKGGEDGAYPSVYSELLFNSSEEDFFGYKEKKLVDLDTDLRWDPTTYYPIPRKAQGLSEPIQSKPIELKDLSSPAININRTHGIVRDQLPMEPMLSSPVLNKDRRVNKSSHTSRTAKKKHRRHNFTQPLY